MKKILLCVGFAILLASPLLAQKPNLNPNYRQWGNIPGNKITVSQNRSTLKYCIEDFVNWPPNGWTLSPSSGTGVWQQGPLMVGTPTQGAQSGESGSHFAEFDTWDYKAGVSGSLVSPLVNLSGATSPILKYYFWNHTDETGYGNSDSTVVYLSADSGNTWKVIDVLKGNVDNWTPDSINITGYIDSTIEIKFTGISDYGGTNMGIDHVLIGQKPNYDAGIASIISPTTYTDPDSSISPTCILTNIGLNPDSDFYAHLTIDSLGTTIYSDSILVSGLSPNTPDTITFSPWTNYSGYYYSFTFYTALNSDGYANNDTLKTITRCYSNPRMVIGELATNTNCGGCAAANDTLDSIYTSMKSEIALVRYHAWWPDSTDPFYQANKGQNQDRILYYGADYTPHLHIDGDFDGTYNSNSWRNNFSNALTKHSPMTISLSGIYHPYTKIGTLFTTIKVTGVPTPADTSLHIRYAITESDLQYNAPNGESHFDQIFRYMFPNTTGIPITITKSQTVSDTEVFADTSNWVSSNCDIVVFVQNDADKHILQGAKIKLSDITGISTDKKQSISKLQLIIPKEVVGNKAYIKYSLPMASRVKISIIDLSGKIMATITNSVEAKGSHIKVWNTKNFAPGVYFISLNTDTKKLNKKLIIIK